MRFTHIMLVLLFVFISPYVQAENPRVKIDMTKLSYEELFYTLGDNSFHVREAAEARIRKLLIEDDNEEMAKSILLNLSKTSDAEIIQRSENITQTLLSQRYYLKEEQALIQIHLHISNYFKEQRHLQDILQAIKILTHEKVIQRLVPLAYAKSIGLEKMQAVGLREIIKEFKIAKINYLAITDAPAGKKILRMKLQDSIFTIFIPLEIDSEERKKATPVLSLLQAEEAKLLSIPLKIKSKTANLFAQSEGYVSFWTAAILLEQEELSFFRSSFMSGDQYHDFDFINIKIKDLM